MLASKKKKKRRARPTLRGALQMLLESIVVGIGETAREVAEDINQQPTTTEHPEAGREETTPTQPSTDTEDRPTRRAQTKLGSRGTKSHKTTPTATSWVAGGGTCPATVGAYKTSSTSSSQPAIPRSLLEKWNTGEVLDTYETEDGLRIVIKRSGRTYMLVVESLPPKYARCRIRYKRISPDGVVNIIEDMTPLSAITTMAYWGDPDDDKATYKIIGLVCPES